MNKYYAKKAPDVCHGVRVQGPRLGLRVGPVSESDQSPDPVKTLRPLILESVEFRSIYKNF